MWVTKSFGRRTERSTAKLLNRGSPQAAQDGLKQLLILAQDLLEFLAVGVRTLSITLDGAAQECPREVWHSLFALTANAGNHMNEPS
jgi:hypothetical protein